MTIWCWNLFLGAPCSALVLQICRTQVCLVSDGQNLLLPSWHVLGQALVRVKMTTDIHCKDLKIVVQFDIAQVDFGVTDLADRFGAIRNFLPSDSFVAAYALPRSAHTRSCRSTEAFRNLPFD